MARLRLAALLAREDEARRAKRGLWADDAFAVRAADDMARLEQDAGTFQIVQGRIVSAQRRSNTVYLDFGADYRSDFTVMIPKDALPAFTAAGVKPVKLAGRTVRVRGWVSRFNGPAVEVTGPAGLEILD